jgi:hypothetical protein
MLIGDAVTGGSDVRARLLRTMFPKSGATFGPVLQATEKTEVCVPRSAPLTGVAAEFAGLSWPRPARRADHCNHGVANGAGFASIPSRFPNLKGSVLKTLNKFEHAAPARRILPAVSAGMRSLCRAAV